MRKNSINIICFILVFILAISFGIIFAIQNNHKENFKFSNNLIQSSGNIINKEEKVNEKYFLPHSLVAISGRSADDLANQFEETGKVEKIVVNDSGTDHDSITMYITKEQKEFWIKSRKELLDEYNKKISAYNPKYHIEYSYDCTNLSLYYDADLNTHKVAEFLYLSQFLCGMYQVLNGINNDDWNVNICIYNSKTGKLVASGSSNDGVSYEEEDWVRSEE